MGLRTHIAKWLTTAKRATLAHPPAWLVDIFSGSPASAGVRVTPRDALQYTPFWAAVRQISGTLASLPFKVYERLDGGGKRPRSEHRVYGLLHDRPNPYMDALTFVETRQAHALCYGNGYAEIQRDGAGRAIALWPLLPNKTRRKLDAGGVPYYEVTLPTGGTVAIADENVLHIKGLGFDGYTGYDVVSFHREALGYGMAVKEYGARFFANDANPGGVYESPNPLTDKAYQRLKDAYEKAHRGLTNAHRIAILEEGTKWNAVGVDPQKAQALEVQKWTVDDCARIFLMPPHKIASMEFSKYANVYELNIDFYISPMLYWFRKWESEVSYKLFGSGERGRLFAEILAEAMLRGNLEAQAAYFKAGREGGWLCADDIREKMNMNPLPDGKGQIFLQPLNFAEAGTAPPAPQASPQPDGDPIRAAHEGLLAAQCRRIITKQRAASRGREADTKWWAAHRAWAQRILSDCVKAYAQTRRQCAAQPDTVLGAALVEWLDPQMPLLSGDAEAIAADICDRIGGHHGTEV
jgi:HK97 family phage portal protein